MGDMTAPALRSADEAIRGAGLRITESRRAVYEALAAHPHATAEDVHAALSSPTSLQSVYNALGDFAAAGLVRRIEPAGHPMMFELRVDDNHHHLVCTQCGAIEDVDCAVGHAPCLLPGDARGYRVAVAEVTYWGLCARCASDAA
ncbi:MULTISPECIES: Fur family transcriptional regulator [Microbacterium]|uniref:Fur family transcriptional regulator n=1 Tax=Microbacterium TaxID=33882 RepID=UPI002349049D|nr:MULTISPECIES: Fur family transcriptional regulator [Microbacterium]UWF78204.1 transcriptional repressor [Microbacterium neungamense]WCM56376.1 transcriptional repressor [Microbacterium sp. EF45047]